MLMVNSEDNIVDVPKTVFADFPNLEKRKSEMLEILQYISDNIGKKMNVAYSYQEKGYKERAYIPFREEILSSDKLAKKYIEYKNGNYREEDDIDILKSIVRVKSESSIRFFLLTLGCITIERNYVDNKIISAEYTLPVTYSTFINAVKQDDTYTFISDIAYKIIFKNGIVVPYSNGISKLNDNIKRLIAFLNKNNATYSNKANECLEKMLNERTEFFAEYKTIKNMIIKTFPKSRGIIYERKNSCINAIIKKNGGETFITIFVYGTADNPCYIFRGKSANNVGELKHLLISGIYDENEKEEEWFRKIINIKKGR